MRKNLASRAFGWLPLFVVLGSGCSLVYDLSPDQCGSNTDCNHFGPNLSCQNGVCVCLSDACSTPMTSGGTGATGGKGGTSSGGTGGNVGGTTGGTTLGGEGGMGPETGGTTTAGGTGGSTGATGGKGGTSGKGGAGGTTTTGGTSGDAGMAGMPEPPECSTNNECFTLHQTEFKTNPYACVSGKCIPLITDECPVVLPASEVGTWDSLLSKDPIMLGGFGYVNHPSLYSIATRNYDLALTEMNTSTLGVYAGTSAHHKMVMVVCDAHVQAPGDETIPANHLINELGIKGIVSELDSDDQQVIFEEYGQPNDVFFMVPPYSDDELINLDDSGLVWQMLSGPSQLSVTYQPLMEMVETHLRNLKEIPAGTNNMKVALVVGQDQRFLNEMGNYITQKVTFNGAKAGENGEATFQTWGITSYYTNTMVDYSYTVQQIVAFAPHVILGVTADEAATSIIPLIENNWDAANPGIPRPFYILSPLDYNINAMKGLIQSSDSTTNNTGVPLFQRVIGTNWPAAEDQTNYLAYQDRFYNKYHLRSDFYDNYYDSAWYLLYGVAAASQPIRGTSIVEGLIRATTPNSTEYNVGPDAAPMAVNAVRNNGKIKVIGAMGPPNWDTKGSRSDPASVWCLTPVPSFAFKPDQYRYNPTSMQLEGTTWKASCNYDFPAAAQ